VAAAAGAAAGAAPGGPVEEATARIAAALDAGDDLTTDRELAGPLGLTERRLREMFRERLGVTPRAWAVARRAELLRSRLAGGQPVLPALFDAGYGSASAAYEAANGELGMAPGRYRTGAAGKSIRWTIAPIPQGVALVAATERGLCSILMGHETEALASELRAGGARRRTRCRSTSTRRRSGAGSGRLCGASPPARRAPTERSPRP
jgi:AraC family transcriptional regulator of adaptative response/methylated-DNA-[protein]-cysteine methyltransferase